MKITRLTLVSALALLLIAFSVPNYFPNLVPHVNAVTPTLVQSAYCSASVTSTISSAGHSHTNCSTPFYASDFSFSTTAGDILLIGVTELTQNEVVTISDSQSNSIHFITDNGINSGSTKTYIAIYYINNLKAALETVNVTVASAAYLGIWLQEWFLPGSVTSVSSSIGSSSTIFCCYTGGFSQTGVLSFSVARSDIAALGTWSSTSGYTKVYINPGNEVGDFMQYSTAQAGLSTTPVSFTGWASGKSWTMASASINYNPACPKTIGLDQKAVSNTTQVTLTQAVCVGSTLVVVGTEASGNNQGVSMAISDNTGNSWYNATKVSYPIGVSASPSVYVVIAYANNSLSAADAFSINCAGVPCGGAVFSIAAYELSGWYYGGSNATCAYAVNAACHVSVSASFVVSGWSGTAQAMGTITAVGFSSIDNNAGPTSGIITQGDGTYTQAGGTNGAVVAEAGFGLLLVTATNTITGFLVPNYVNNVNSFSWLYFLIVVFLPMGEIVGVITADRRAVLDRHSLIFIFLGLLLLDSIFGVMLNVVTVTMPFIFGILFGIYLWRGRG